MAVVGVFLMKWAFRNDWPNPAAQAKMAHLRLPFELLADFQVEYLPQFDAAQILVHRAGILPVYSEAPFPGKPNQTSRITNASHQTVRLWLEMAIPCQLQCYLANLRYRRFCLVISARSLAFRAVTWTDRQDSLPKGFHTVIVSKETANLWCDLCP